MKAFKVAVSVLALSAGVSFGAEIDEALVASELAKGVKVELWPSNAIPMRKEGTTPFTIKNTNGGNVRLTNVVIPQMAYFPASGEGRRPAVVVCPGGGYAHLSYTCEGTEIAAWLNSLGFTAFVLVYRTPDQPELALADAQRAFSLVRSRAAEFNVDPDRLGMIGFSAGGNLTARLSTNWRVRKYAAVDAADAFSCRPDFSMPVYPWRLVPGECTVQPLPTILRGEFPVDAATSPAFIVQTEDDFAKIENALAYYTALKQAGVPAEMHLFTSGGHGYGIRKHGTPVDGWEKLAAVWLKREFGSSKANVLTEKEAADGWKLLWDGKTSAGWVGVKNGFAEFPKAGWTMENGELTVHPCRVCHTDGRWEKLPPEQAKFGGGGDIVTVKKYRDFELSLEFKLTPRANSGIKYYYDEKVNGGTCEEYQILEATNVDYWRGKDGNHRVAALYDLIPAKAEAHLKPIELWNVAHIVSKGGHVEHWLNGEKVVAYDRGSAAFRAAVAGSKYATKGVDADGKPQPWGEVAEGRILLQDHTCSTVSYRNIKIREL